MNAIYGIFNRNAKPVLPIDLKIMESVMWDFGAYSHWSDGPIGLGQFISTVSFAHPPIANGELDENSSDTFRFIATGRLDNALEIVDLLKIPQKERTCISDFEIMRLAYGTWGKGCASRLYGDWSFAAWHQSEQRLVLARDHHGNTALYYYLDHKVFAFATSRQALLALNLAPIELDELYLAQMLTSWFAYYGERTLHSPIKRLPPSHQLEVTNERCDIHCYWRLEDTPELQLSNRHDYVDAFQEIFNEAVRCRMRSSGMIGVSMSGGLDSSSVAAVAAKYLKTDNMRLPAFTSVPYYDPVNYTEKRFGNEFTMAESTANKAGNIDLYPISSASESPIRAIRRVLQMNCDPTHGACNLYWILDIRQAAKSMGCTTLLTGALGNGGMSWGGSVFSQSLSYLLLHLPPRELIKHLCNRTKHNIKSVAPSWALTAIQRYRLEKKEWWRSTAIHPDFARKIGLLELRLAEQNEEDSGSSREQRCQVLMPGRSIAGALTAELGAAYGLSILDPTADTRVLSFTFSVPDRIFIDPITGADRWLIRESMKGYLPEEVRLNRKRGLQASDLVQRLRACAGDVEDALNELGNGPASGYVDVDYLRRVWSLVLEEDSVESYLKASNILSRGIMAGLFVNRFYA